VARSLNFARRPFTNERPFLFAAGVALLLGLVLLLANVRQWTDFHREIAGTSIQVDALEARRDKAVRDAAASRAALENYRVSSLATQSKALLRLVAERRFSWTGLLARLEKTLPPEVRVTRLAPRFDESGRVTLDFGLVAKAQATISQTLVALSKDPAFDAIQLKAESVPETAAAEGYVFDVTARYTPGGAAR
jgi:hypothetical protein